METQKNFHVEDELTFLDPLVAKWFNNSYSGLTEAQSRAIPLIHSGENVLVSSPTGTGKTLSGFLAIINELFIKARNGELEDKIYCLYISPLKALANDINKNLKQPLEGIYTLSRQDGLVLKEIRVAVRSGDTPQNERQKMLRKPPHILITTPESFSLSLSAPKFKESLKSVKYVIVDEIHEISSNKRGSLLSLNLERLSDVVPNFVRIGLSATQAPLETIGHFLCGYDGEKPRQCKIIDVDTKKFLDLKTITPVHDLTMTSYEVANEKMYDVLTDLISKHRTTLIFTNTRSGTEHVAMRLKARGIESIEAHHSSLGKETRLDVEQKLKDGELKCVITSTSLELGIDIGYIDLVVQIGTPKSVSKALQRTGRAGHGINDISKGRFVVFDLDDLVECAVLTKAAYDREIDKVVVPTNALDVLAQVIVGMSLEHSWSVKDALSLIRKSYSYHTLKEEDFISVLNYLAGTVEENAIYSKIWFDRDEGVFGKKRSSRMIYFMNVGTIPEDADYQVINERGKNIGKLSDKFVERLKSGDIFVLGARTYMYLRTSKNKVMVKDGQGMRPTVPSWTGEMLPRSYDLGRLIGRFREEASARIKAGIDITDWLMKDYHLDDFGANSIISYLKGQMKFGMPTDNMLLVEGYIDSQNLYSTIFHVPLGRRVNDALSRAYAQALANRYSVNSRITVTDDGFIITSPVRIPISEQIRLINSGNFVDTVERSVVNTEAFKQRFRHCATRSLMVLRRYKGYDMSVTRQQLRSDKVLRALEETKDFPVMIETYREIMEDMMDVPRALNYVRDVIDAGRYTIIDFRPESSPFSYGMILAGVSDIVLMEDRAKLLRELQGKILDKIYGDRTVRFLVDNVRTVEQFYRSKAGTIRGKDDIERFAKHFLYIDPFRARFNGPRDYATYDISSDIESLIQSDVIVSSHVRNTEWVHRDYRDIVRTLFRKDLTLYENDRRVLEFCDSISFAHLRSRSNLSDSELKESLVRLESSYMVRRKYVDNNIVYTRDELPFREMEFKDALVKAVRLVLSSMGPMTRDEILIRIPVDEESLAEVLNRMSESGEVAYDYVSPVYAKQYILNDDLKELAEFSPVDILQGRIARLAVPVNNIEEYFLKYGYFVDPWSVMSRYHGFSSEELLKLQREGKVIFGKIVKHKDTYMAVWLAEALRSLRYENPTDDMKKILHIIEQGYGNEKEIAQRSGMEKSYLKKVLTAMEYQVMIYRDEYGLFRSFMPDAQPMDRCDAFRILLEKYGPFSAEEISRNFWFYVHNLPDTCGARKSIVSGRTLFGDFIEDQQRDIIIRKGDPLEIYYGNYSFSEYNSMYIHNGKDSAVMNIDRTGDLLWISSIRFENESAAHDLVLHLKEAYAGHYGSVVIEDPPNVLASILPGSGFRHSGKLYSIGSIFVTGESIKEFLFHAISRNSSIDRKGGIYSLLGKQIFGVRSDFEIAYLGMTGVQFRNYVESRLILQFNGPFGVNSYATQDVISLYRTLREGEPLSQESQKVLKIIIELGKASDEDIHRRVGGLKITVRAIVKELFSRCYIAKEFEGKYVFVGEKYRKEEAYERLIMASAAEIGYVNTDLFSRIIGFQDTNVARYLEDLLSQGKLSKVAFSDLRSVVYCLPETAAELGKANHGDVRRIISPKDLLYRAYEKIFRNETRGRGMHYFISSGRIECAFSAQKNGRLMEVTSVTGNRKAIKDLKSELTRLGFSVNIKES